MRRNFVRRFLKFKTRLKVHIDDCECMFAFDEMVSRMTGDFVPDYRMVKWEILTNDHGRAPGVDDVRNESTKQRKLSG